MLAAFSGQTGFPANRELGEVRDWLDLVDREQPSSRRRSERYRHVVSFLARIERRCARQIGSGHPVRRTSRTWSVIGDALLSCLVAPVHSTGAGILRLPGGASFLAQVPGRCQEAGLEQQPNGQWR